MSSDCETVDDILTEFAKRDPSGYLVWGQRIGRAYREEAKNRENEARGANDLTDALNAEVKRLTAEIEKLKFDNMHLKSGQRTAGEVIIEQTNKVEAKDEEIKKIRKVVEDALGESRFAVCHLCDQKWSCGHGTEKFDPCCIYKDIDNAIAAIRGVGGAK